MASSAASRASPSAAKDQTLSLNSRLSLTIKGDALHIHDSRPDRKTTRGCCGLDVGKGQSPERVIPTYDILWAESSQSIITISYAEKIKKSAVKPATWSFAYHPEIHSAVEEFVEALQFAAYGESQLRKRLKILINPFGGTGIAATVFETHCKPILEASRCVLDVETTTHNGHAMEIAEGLDIDAYDAVVCCSGDGVPHEVFNGFGNRADALKVLRKIAVCQLPAGSGNAMCWNLTGVGSPGIAALSIVKSVRKAIDLISITQGEKRFLSFLSQSFGIIAEVDLGTEDLRWMGDLRFTYGLLQRILKQMVYPCDIAVKVVIDDKELIRDHYRQGGASPSSGDVHDADHKGLPQLRFGNINSPLPEDWELVHHPNMGNFYAGNMAWMSAGVNFFPASLPNDGMFDLVCVDGTVSRSKAIKMLLAVETGSHFEMPHVLYRKVAGYRIIPHKREGVLDEYISIDGERIPFAPFQAEVHNGMGTVLARSGVYMAPGV